jgi:hypothetical protein
MPVTAADTPPDHNPQHGMMQLAATHIGQHALALAQA